MENENVLNDKNLEQVIGGTKDILPKDHYENIILSSSTQEKSIDVIVDGQSHVDRGNHECPTADLLPE